MDDSRPSPPHAPLAYASGYDPGRVLDELRLAVGGIKGAMPSDDIGDAVHLACATWYRVPHLLTWNCKHLANANKFEHIHVLHARRRLISPMIVTPEQLLELEP